MSDVLKFDWIPVYVHRAKASETWKLEDYKFGWFWKLLFNSVDSDKPGYLPNDVDGLWRLAGARTKEFFLKRGGLDLVGRYFRRTADGLWIYNPRLVQILTEQAEKKGSKARKYKPSFFLRDIGLVQEIFEKAYNNYPRHVGKAAAEKAFTSALARHVKNGEVGECAEMIAERAEKFAQTPAGKRGTYTPHMSTWLNQDRFLDDEREWFTEPIDGKKSRASEIQQNNRAAIKTAFARSVGLDPDGLGAGTLSESVNHSRNGSGLSPRLVPIDGEVRETGIRDGAAGICLDAEVEGVFSDAGRTGGRVRTDEGKVRARAKTVSITD